MAKEKTFIDWLLYGALTVIFIIILGFVVLILYSLISIT